MYKLRSYRKYLFVSSTILVACVIGALAIVALYPSRTAAQEAQAGEMITPAAGSTLEDSTATFTWSEGLQVQSYYSVNSVLVIV